MKLKKLLSIFTRKDTPLLISCDEKFSLKDARTIIGTPDTIELDSIALKIVSKTKDIKDIKLKDLKVKVMIMEPVSALGVCLVPRIVVDTDYHSYTEDADVLSVANFISDIAERTHTSIK